MAIKKRNQLKNNNFLGSLRIQVRKLGFDHWQVYIGKLFDIFILRVSFSHESIR